LKRYLGVILALLALTLLAPACGDDDDDGGGNGNGASNDAAVLEQVSQALHAKYGEEPGFFELTLDTVVDGRYAKGGVRDEFSGAIWFAALVDGEWRIVWDGNGVVDCADLEAYEDFPASLLPTCFDSSDGSLVER
jgi:hypothetical protein